MTYSSQALESDRSASARGGPKRPPSQADMVLMAFHQVSKGSTSRVPYEELVIQAWQQFPSAFSLRNHPEFPDASDIHKKLYQTLKPAGLVVSLGNKTFRLTDKGIERAEQLLAALDARETQQSPLQSVRLSRGEESFIREATRSRAFTTWTAGRSENLIDHDARMFFQFSTGTPIHERQIRVKTAMEAIGKARSINRVDADELLKLATFMTSKFNSLFEGA